MRFAVLSTLLPTLLFSAAVASAAAPPASPDEMVAEVRRLVTRGSGALIPDLNEAYIQDGGLVPLGEGSFSAMFLHGLVAEWRDGVAVFPVEVRLDDETGDAYFLNALGETFWYVPSEIPERHRPWLVANPWFAPSRTGVRWTFVHDAEAALLRAAAAADSADIRRTEPLRSLPLPPVTSLCFTGFSHTGTSVWFSAAWPASALPLPGGALDVYAKTNLLDARWFSLAEMPVAPAATNATLEIPGEDVPGFFIPPHVHDETCPALTNITFDLVQNTLVTGIVYRCYRYRAVSSGFFRLGTREDTDCDGLFDAFERLVMGTSPYMYDTDEDGLSDSDELDLGTNPLIADTDGDGLPDGWEADRPESFDPLDPAEGLSDADDDGIPLWRELFVLHTDPDSWDTDADGVSDAEEIGLDTCPFIWDTDGDGLCDGDEVRLGTNPCHWDTDHDNLSDEWEHDRHPFDPFDPTDGMADDDGDGLSNGFEVSEMDTDWRQSDTDGDGLSDRMELIRGTDPLLADTDEDGLSDGEEDVFGTSPFQWDTDCDGCPDGWETKHGFNPCSALSPDMGADPDGDGLSNADECSLGTNPFAADTDGDGIADRAETGWFSVSSSAPWELPGAVALLSSISDHDEGFVTIPLLFPISVQNGSPCSNLAVSINGVLALSEIMPSRMPEAAGEGTPLLIRAFSDNLIAHAGSSLCMAEILTNGVQHLVVEYRNFGFPWLPADETNSVSFQVDIPGPTPEAILVRFFRTPVLRNDPPLSDRALGSHAWQSVETARNEVRRPYGQPTAVPGTEVAYHLGTGTDPARADTDGDGLSDAEEPSFGTDPTRADTDDDGLFDAEEISAGLSPTTPGDGGSDPDLDGLPNETEILLGTDPLLADTDGDGFSDGNEWAQGSDPLDADDHVPHGVVPVMAVFGDPSSSRSERYELTVTPVSGDARAPMSVVNHAFGDLDEVQFRLLANAVYEVSIRPVASSLKVPDPDYRLTIQASEPSGGTAALFLDPEDLLGDHYDAPSSQFEKRVRIAFVRARLLADRNRDGAIDENDAVPGPLRLWINDDCDGGDVNTAVDDIPGWALDHYVWHRRNFKNGGVDGSGDLLDMFPVWLDVSDALNAIRSTFPDARVRLELSQADEAVAMASAAGIPRTECGAFRTTTAFGDFRDASLRRVGPEGWRLDDEDVGQALAGPDGLLFLMEGTGESVRPLALELKAEGRLLCRAELPLSVSAVENMFFFHNLRPDPHEVPDRPGDPPNNPAAECSDLHVFLAHGFLVTEQESRAWGSEFFKRFWQEGSRARFHMVTWKGDEGPTALSYESNVRNAFETAGAYASLVNGISGDRAEHVVVLAHSLGNMLTSAAICDGGLKAKAYFALNGAVPAEAYSTDLPDGWNDPDNPLVHSEWREYPPRSWASRWHELFADPVLFPDDDRARLTWRGRFAAAAPILHNYYSSGDEVLELRNGNDGPILLSGMEVAFVWDWLPVSVNARRFVWQKQALFKGRSPFFGTQWAGWGFDGYADEGENFHPTYSSAAATAADDGTLRTCPVFRHYPEWMFLSSIPFSGQCEILARGIPELTPTIGSEAVAVFGNDRNDDMIDFADNSWPSRSIDFSDHGDNLNRWLHTDLLSVPHFFTHKLFHDLVDKGGMK